jgi:hypothetical protein
LWARYEYSEIYEYLVSATPNLKTIALNYPMVLPARAIYTAVCAWSAVGGAALVGGTAYVGGTTYATGVILPHCLAIVWSIREAVFSTSHVRTVSVTACRMETGGVFAGPIYARSKAATQGSKLNLSPHGEWWRPFPPIIAPKMIPRDQTNGLERRVSRFVQSVIKITF